MKYKITLKGRTYEVEVEHGEAMLIDEYDAIAPAPAAAPVAAAPVAAAPAPAAAAAPAPAAAPAAVAGTPVTAPLPGNVLEVKVKPGESVKAGQLLVLIEAMKMENEVFAPADGIVKQILAQKGALVATGDTLLVI